MIFPQLSEVNTKCDDLERRLYERTEMLKIELSRKEALVKGLREELAVAETKRAEHATKAEELASQHRELKSEISMLTEKVRSCH